MSGPVDKISGIHSLQKMRRELENFQALARFAPLIRLFGATGRKMAAPLEKVPELAAQMKRMSELPDRFNDLFADRGWIAYELMKMDVMERAIAVAETEGIEKAEELLADYYDEENIRWQLRLFRGIGSFELRMPLAEKALVDYLAGRYHACVPVVLLILDGFVDDMGKVNRGLFAKDVDLTAWDSISAHENGLGRLARTFGKKRMKTTTEVITVPYRHGILHGHDLGYDNRLVAAKCWAALFALRDWAVARRDQRRPKPEEKVSFMDSLRRYAEIHRQKEIINAWRPRSESELHDIPRSGLVEHYMDGSPERCVVEFLELWKRGNYGHMARLLQGVTPDKIGRRAAQIRRDVEGRTLDSFSIAEVKDDAPAISVVEVELQTRQINTGEISVSTKSVRVLFQNESGDPMTRGMKGGKWSLVDLDVIL